MRIAGYKWLFASAPRLGGRIALESGFDGYEWSRGTNVASYAPGPDNLWGFNAYYDARRARWGGRKFGTVLAGVCGFGAVALFDHGWRAEKAEIVCCCLPWMTARTLPAAERARLRRGLAETYDVPVVTTVRALRSETERFGVRGTLLLRDD